MLETRVPVGSGGVGRGAVESSSGVRAAHEQGFNRAPGCNPSELNTLLCVCE